ncbi:hypothetical protein ASD24_03885 [Paenibacillus sp. Root52]|uniref:hypothetical protein n=1 Tax=Paenibacillus sp. Root52 TaxID=1736552 RepID=UPI000701E7CF|nr:hypothetical protein [Paenibacillus sp. Root52]KQY94693.1 hypothetical protein ASD24_03885 [Paenibacillus sp. Root52]
MYAKDYRYIGMKIIAVFVSTLILSLYGSWRAYTPESDRVSDVGYYSFGGIFAIQVVPIFFVFIILGIMLSPFIDTMIFNKFHSEGVKGLITFVIAYLLLGVVSGIMISIFFRRVDSILFFSTLSITGSMIFLVVQLVLQGIIYKRRAIDDPKQNV